MGRCLNGVFSVTSPCAGGTQCFVLPLVNKPGTSVACSTEADKAARFAAAGVGASSSSAEGTSNIIPQQQSPPIPAAQQAAAVSNAATLASDDTGATNNAGDFVCIDDTRFRQFTGPGKFILGSCPPGFCATRIPPKKNPCIGKANADRVDKGEKVKRRLVYN